MNRRDVEKAVSDNWQHFGRSWKTVKAAADKYAQNQNFPEFQARGSGSRKALAACAAVSCAEQAADTRLLRRHSKGASQHRQLLGRWHDVRQTIGATREDCHEVTGDWTGWSEDTIYRNSKEKQFMARPIGYKPKKM